MRYVCHDTQVPQEGDTVLDRIDHVGIACHDLAATIARYEAVFDLTVASREVIEDQGVREAMLRVSDGPAGASWIQLLEPLGPGTPVGKFLARRGEGVHHIGYGVASITAALAAVSARGVRLLDQRPRHGSMGASIAFLHPKDLTGVLTELVEAPHRAAGHDLPGKRIIGRAESQKPPSSPEQREYAARDRASGSVASEPAG